MCQTQALIILESSDYIGIWTSFNVGNNQLLLTSDFAQIIKIGNKNHPGNPLRSCIYIVSRNATRREEVSLEVLSALLRGSQPPLR